MNTDNYPPYFHQYIEKVPSGDPIALLAEGMKESLRTLVLMSDDQANHRYEAGKWSIKEIVQHLIDTERIFSYRALSFARGEKKALAGYDHEAYVQHSNADYRNLKELLEEWKTLRQSTIQLFQSFSRGMMEHVGNANGLDIGVEQLMYVIIGHELHHMHIIHTRYL